MSKIHKIKSIKDEAAKYLDLFERQENKEKDRRWIAFKGDVIMSGNEHYEKLSEVMRKIECSEDFVYEQTWNCLSWLVDGVLEDPDEIEDMLLEAIDREVDIYTSDLTGWLNKSVWHVYYLGEALKLGSAEDGFQLLMRAQYCAIEEVWREIIHLIQGE